MILCISKEQGGEYKLKDRENGDRRQRLFLRASPVIIFFNVFFSPISSFGLSSKLED